MSVFLEFRANFKTWVASGKARDNRYDAQTRFVNTVGQTVSKNFRYGIERENLKIGVKKLTGYDNQNGFDSALNALRRIDISENQVNLALCLYFYILCEGPDSLQKEIEASIFVTNRKFENVFGGKDGKSREYFTGQAAKPDQKDDRNSEASGSSTQPSLQEASATEQASDYQPPLDAPPRRSDADTPPHQLEGRLRYGTQITKVFGRKAEQQQLRDFANSDAGDIDFWWTQLAGVAGQGKSRLALELIYELQDENWRAGFLPSNEIKTFTQNAKEWMPSRPHLIVIDYVLGYEAVIGDLIRGLMRKTAYPHAVRLLLLERQRRDRGGADVRTVSDDGRVEFVLSDKTAGWFDTMVAAENSANAGSGYRIDLMRYAKNVIELNELRTSQLISIVRAYVSDSIIVSEEELEQRLKRLDPSGRPLFALILAEVLQSERSVESVDWSRAQYLDFVVSENMRKRWYRYFEDAVPEIYVSNPVIEAALLATIVRGLRRADLVAYLGSGYSTVCHEQVLVIQDAPIQKGALGPSAFIPPLEPDLLGGWMVMQAMRGSVDIPSVLENAWAVSPVDTGATLRRIVEDFRREEDIVELFQYEPVESVAKNEFAKAITGLLTEKWEEDCTFSQREIGWLKRASDAGDGKASNLLGLTFHYGNGLTSDVEKAVRYFEIGMEQKSDFARENFASALYQGIGLPKDVPRAIQLLENNLSMRRPNAMRVLANALIEQSTDLERATRLLKTAAESGDASAMFDLAWHLSTGSRIAISDPFEITNWYREAALAGHPIAMGLLAFRLEEGIGVESADPKEAILWYKRAAQSGKSPAAAGMARYLEKLVRGDFPEPEGAMKWARKAAESENPEAMFNLACMLQEGYPGQEADPFEAMSWYRKAAKVGHKKAMHNYAHNLEHGVGVETVDPKKAVKWYRRAAELGSAPSMALLASNLERGNGVDAPDLNEAMKWYLEAAKAENVPAMVDLAHNLGRGFGGRAADPVQATIWYGRAAEQGNLSAMYHFAYNVGLGIGTEAPDRALSMIWFRRAAEKGHVQSMYNLAVGLANGFDSVPANSVEAMTWFRSAAKAGEPAAMFYLALNLEKGVGVDAADPIEAIKWYGKAVEAGNPQAANNLGRRLLVGTSKINPDWVEARRLFHVAAEGGEPKGMTNLGFLCAFGIGGPFEPLRAASWWFKGFTLFFDRRFRASRK